jgi:hypothetical protein
MNKGNKVLSNPRHKMAARSGMTTSMNPHSKPRLVTLYYGHHVVSFNNGVISENLTILDSWYPWPCKLSTASSCMCRHPGKRQMPSARRQSSLGALHATAQNPSPGTILAWRREGSNLKLGYPMYRPCIELTASRIQVHKAIITYIYNTMYSVWHNLCLLLLFLTPRVSIKPINIISYLFIKKLQNQVKM